MRNVQLALQLQRLFQQRPATAAAAGPKKHICSYNQGFGGMRNVQLALQLQCFFKQCPAAAAAAAAAGN
jgi:hypothetical protein